MSEKSVHRQIPWTEADRARHKAIRERYANKPSLDDLLTTGDYTEPLPLADFLELRHTLAELKAAREAAGLSLADVSERAGIDPEQLSRLEQEPQTDPTLGTLRRYARAVGKEIGLTLTDLPATER